MPFQSMEQGIKAIQAGQLEQGARLLRIALKDPQLTGHLRAVSYLWLAETKDDRQFKQECYQKALAADPDNADVRQRLSLLYTSELPNNPPKQNPPSSNPNSPSQNVPPQTPGNTPSQGMPPTNPPAQVPGMPGNTPSQGMPPTNPPGMPGNTPSQGMPPTRPGNVGGIVEPPRLPTDTTPMQAPQSSFISPPTPTDSQTMHPIQQQIQTPQPQQYAPQQFYPNVGIFDGPNGRGTGFFVTRDGLIATTRYVTGGLEDLSVEISEGHRLRGRVVRAFPEYDLAFIRVDMTVNQLLMISNQPTIAPHATLMIIPYGHRPYRGTHRQTEHQLPSHWFPTDLTHVQDAGGNPVFNDRNHLIGMLTRNASRTTQHVYGLHSTMIFRCVEHYIQETQVAPNRIYCPCCGYVSRAAAFQAFYCENCGCTLPHATNLPRYPQQHTDPLYNENMHSPCPNCQARVGYYNDTCLRCGHKSERRR